ncbi:4-hydroxythreonine-4-phosphate dehydrogenase [Planctomycetales bacterium]|nr:4-hydroxythreonine-4-phosphate dehydrogenase [Planctomycetales bacterium]
MRTLGITIGDIAGIGPEIIVRAWSQIASLPDCRCVVYGHTQIIRRACSLCSVTAEIPCIQCCDDTITEVAAGTVDARSGKAAYQALLCAIDDAKAGKIDGIVTAPLNKAALNLAGYHYPGHTEILAERCGSDDFAMMLYLGHGENIRGQNGLAVVHVTLHTAMKTIFEQITIESVLAKAKLADSFMRKINPALAPRIGVCSLNPHAGEDGLFGDEEIRIIRPAVERARTEGLHIDHPKPADTIMLDARNGLYDAVVAMFHDQGHIALKLLGMYRAVNVTLGLPIIRTSPAHGTAFDRAWQGTANPQGLLEAVKTAERLAR